ncbi:unnamed protein product [Lactuca virosa]|uniref:Uncharacterized protein n=1 Tax=Lactuca virosa TaxID=75947 RepID=A0AAU9NA55_9ASTR|nr:unnamed protein product [Lactuca virosa]
MTPPLLLHCRCRRRRTRFRCSGQRLPSRRTTVSCRCPSHRKNRRSAAVLPLRVVAVFPTAILSRRCNAATVGQERRCCRLMSGTRWVAASGSREWCVCGRCLAAAAIFCRYAAVAALFRRH